MSTSEQTGDGGVPADVAELMKGVGLPTPDADDPKTKDEYGPDDESEAAGKVDAELEAAATDEDRDRIREQRRKDRHNRKDRQRQAREDNERRIAAQEQEIARLRKMVVGVQGSQIQQQLLQLEQEEREALEVSQKLKSIESEALTQSDGATATEARDRRAQAEARAMQLRRARETITNQLSKPEAPTIDPKVVEHASAFKQRHGWYKGPGATDPDSAVLTALDRTLTAEGWNPASPQYWEELDARAKKYLPNRFASGHNSPRGSPVGGSGRDGGAPQGSSQDYKLSAARVQAIKDAGMWDDPKVRARMIDRYKREDASRSN